MSGNESEGGAHVPQADLSDKQLIELFLQGKGSGFEELVIRYEHKVFQLAYRLCGNPEDASDLAQESFLKVYRGLPQWRGQASFSTWLFRIVNNTFLDEMRKRQRRPQSAFSLDAAVTTEEGEIQGELPSREPGPADQLLEREAELAIERALQSLKPDYRIVLILCDVQGYSYAEIADITGLKLGTVKSRLSRARQAFRKELLQVELTEVLNVKEDEDN